MTGSPLTTSQTIVNSTIVSNGAGLISGQKLNAALNSLYPIFQSMGTWSSTTGVWTPNLAGPSGCSQRQWRSALAASGYLNIVGNAVDPDVNDPTNIQWSCGSLVEQNDALWTTTQTALIASLGSFTLAQMLALLATAQALPF